MQGNDLSLMTDRKFFWVGQAQIDSLSVAGFQDTLSKVSEQIVTISDRVTDVLAQSSEPSTRRDAARAASTAAAESVSQVGTNSLDVLDSVLLINSVEHHPPGLK